MKRTLFTLLALIALSIGTQVSFAACPCNKIVEPCSCSCPTMPCCEDWLCPIAVEDAFCKIGLNECQKYEARKAVDEFVCKTQCVREDGCECESKCECRIYKKALRELDCKMKNILTKCQESDYKCVKNDIMEKVKCCHKCLINPFHRCKCACK